METAVCISKNSYEFIGKNKETSILNNTQYSYIRKYNKEVIWKGFTKFYKDTAFQSLNYNDHWIEQESL